MEFNPPTAMPQACIRQFSQIVHFHLTRLFDLRKSCWELCNSQSVWKSQVLDVFARNLIILAKQAVGFDKTTRYSSDFVGHFSNSFPRNLFSFPRDFFFFPRNFENVRRNQEKIRQNLRKVGENQEKIWEYRGNPQNFSKKEWDKREKQRIVFSRMHHNLVKNCLPF